MSRLPQQIALMIDGFTISVVKNTDYANKGAILLGEQHQTNQRNMKIQHSGSTDPRLGSSVFNDPKCATCGLDGKNCKGHFGYIVLNKPIYNPLFLGQIKQILQVFCLSCSKLLLGKRAVIKFKQEHASDFLSKLIVKSKMVSYCIECDSVQPKIQINTKNIIPQIEYVTDNNQIQTLYIQNILQTLSTIDQSDFEMVFQVSYQPRDLLFYKYFPIPPQHVRPQLTQVMFDSGKTFQNQLTQLYTSFIKAAKDSKEDDSQIYQILGEIYGVKSDKRKMMNKNSFKAKIDKKQGMIRSNIVQKRVENSGRTVIGCSADNHIDEVSIPIKMLQNLSIPTTVTEENRDILQSLVANGKRYPGANFIDRIDSVGNGRSKYKVKGNEKLSLGDIVYRHPLQGERCIMCRQPSLHLYSMNYLKIRPCITDVIQLNNAITDPFNADQ